VLAIHPTSHGFGWIAFESVSAPYDWGQVDAKTDKNAICLRSVETLIARFQPEALVLEAFESRNSSRSDRIARLCRAIVCLADDRGVEPAIYTLGDVRACFAGVGAWTRDEIAAAVARHVELLRNWLPKRRKPWESEHRRLAVYSAAALAITHYRLQSGRLLDGLDFAA
jgi:Holliday junction resolvasome RuvABC endonuclease subunit